jgi:hypothetical protein
MFENGLTNLKAQILNKLNKLLTKEEYYNFQERVYRTNKALSSISKSNVVVSNFNPDEGKQIILSQDFSQESLEQVLEELDKLLLDKQTNGSTIMSFTTSSSEEDQGEEVSKKTLLKNLWNLELNLRSQMHERLSDASTIYSSKTSSPCKEKFLTATPKIGKNFFEDKETVSLRRHSMGEKKNLTLETSFSNQKRRRSEGVQFISSVKKFYPTEEDENFVSNFGLPDICEEDKSEHSD